MSLSDEIKEYFEKVSDEEFLRAVQRAGFRLVPKPSLSCEEEDSKS